jgi:tetratricopeptide (TPR) repeat protein
LELYEKHTNANPGEPQGLLQHAAALVRSAQWHLTTSKLKVYAHPAPESALAESAFGKFSQLISDVKKFSNSAEIEHWRARGEVVFHPTSGSVRSLAGQQQDGEDISLLVQAMARLGNLEGARQLGEQSGSDPQVALQLSLLDFPNGAVKALEWAQAAVAGDPKNPIMHAAAARCYELTGEAGNALDSLKIALFYWEKEALWHAWAGSLAERCSQYEDACAHYEQALEIIPAAKDVAHRLGQIYLKVGRIPEAVDVFSQAVKDDQQNPGLWLYLAEAQYSAGDLPSALASSETAAGLDPSSSAAKVLCGEIALALGGEAKALSLVREALILDPRNVRARLLTSKILAKKGKEKEALAEINRAVEELPDAVDLHIERIRLIHRLHGPAEALKALRPVLQNHPDHEQLLTIQAVACADVGDMEQAEAAALQTLRLNSAQADIQRLLGKIYRQTGQLDKSLHHMSEAARLDPQNVEIYLELGEIYSARREYTQALKAYQQAMNAAPEDYRPFYQSALVLRDGKDYPGAESMMRRAAQLAPHDVNIHRQLGAIVALNLVQSCQEADTCQ